jgi:hypothetical protein
MPLEKIVFSSIANFIIIFFSYADRRCNQSCGFAFWRSREQNARGTGL